jgi:uncharacterized membrane protein
MIVGGKGPLCQEQKIISRGLPAGSLLIGVILGVVFDQPSAGAVAGMALGCAIAIVIWIMDSKRR